MKILHVTPAYYPAVYWGGPVFSSFHLNNALSQYDGVDIKVLTVDAAGTEASKRLKKSDIESIQFPYEVIYAYRLKDPAISLELTRLMPSMVRWADIVHLNATYSYPTLPTLFFSYIYNKKLIWSFRGALQRDLHRHLYDPQTKIRRLQKKIWHSFCKFFMKSENIVLHVTSIQEKEASLVFYSNFRYVVIPNGVDVPSEPPLKQIWKQNNVLNILYLGRLVPIKAVINIIKALQYLDKNFYILRIYGDGDPVYIEKLVGVAKEMGLLNKQIFFMGQVMGDDKEKAFLEADVCVVPSYVESFGMVVAEALARGVPVIVSDSLPWLDVEKYKCGIVSRNDPESLASALKDIYNMNLQQMGLNGWQWVKRDFQHSVIARQMYELYEELLSEPPAKSPDSQITASGNSRTPNDFK